MGKRQREVCIGMLLGLILSLSIPAAHGLAREISDKSISLAVKTELVHDKRVMSHLVDVETKDGIVTLSGSVDNLLANDRAVELARTVKGVRSVVDQLTVKPVARTDEEIYKDVMEALLENPATDAYEIKAAVTDGVVTLTGAVDSWQEKQLCAQVVKGVKGIKDIENEVEVEYEGKRPDGEIEADIENRLAWDVWVDDALVTVTVKNGRVTLSGKVGCAAEKFRAYADAWVAGVKAVDDEDLMVDWYLRDEMRRHTRKSDEEIGKAVEGTIRRDPRISSTDIEGMVDYGIVTLTGVVKSLDARGAAGQLARNTVGVWRVKNHLRVRPPDIGYRTPAMPRGYDTEISEKVRAGLFRDPYVAQHEIRVMISNHRVVLSGRVDSQFKKNRAEDIASRVKRVVAVRNNIVVDRSWTEKSDWEIMEDVKDELWWSPYIDSDEVAVTVQDGIVTLVGVVDSLRDRRIATENAYEGGAKRVRNHLRVRYGPPHLRP